MKENAKTGLRYTVGRENLGVEEWDDSDFSEPRSPVRVSG